MNIKEKLKKHIEDIKLLFKDIETPEVQKLALSDDKEITFSGELKEGVEVKCADVAMADGSHELKDGRKFTVKEGKFVAFEAVAAPADANEALKAEVESLKKANADQASTIKTLDAKFSKVMESQNLMLKSIGDIAENIELEKEKPVGGGEGDDNISKAEWVLRRQTGK
jgi:hypothetical protein